jgi:hypothetical protein
MRITTFFDSFGHKDTLVRSYKQFFETIKPNSQEIAQNIRKTFFTKAA